MRDKILILVNLLLILVCVGCVCYLAMADYVEPPEIEQARKLVKDIQDIERQKHAEGLLGRSETSHSTRPEANQPGRPNAPLQARSESDHNPPVTALTPKPSQPLIAPRPPGPVYPNLGINIFVSLFQPTPTPTPPPTPTPAPPDLTSAVYSWELRSLDPSKASFEEKRTQETFELEVGGPAHDAVDSSNRPLQVKLISVDLNEFKAVLGYENQTVTKSMQ